MGPEILKQRQSLDRDVTDPAEFRIRKPHQIRRLSALGGIDELLKILQIRNSHRLNGYVRVRSLKSRHCIQKNPLIDAVGPKSVPNLQARRLCFYFRAKTRDRHKQCRHQ